MPRHASTRRVYRSIVFVLLALGVACQRAISTTTIILVRHAERPPGTDPDLNDAGRARAESLAVSLMRTKVDAIVHTQFKRTQQTAAPLAAQKSLTPIVVSATGTEAQHAQAVVAQLNAFAGRTVVYVGHSNTVPAVIQALGIAPPAPAIGDSEYSHFFVVTRTGKGSASLVRVRYGQ
jgi:broad specificity phosphatase PhoE